jgi:hypothetical protein
MGAPTHFTNTTLTTTTAAKLDLAPGMLPLSFMPGVLLHDGVAASTAGERSVDASGAVHGIVALSVSPGQRPIPRRRTRAQGPGLVFRVPRLESKGAWTARRARGVVQAILITHMTARPIELSPSLINLPHLSVNVWWR